MIAGIVAIAAIAALVLSIKSLRSLTIVHDRADSLILSQRCDRWQLLSSLVIAGAGKMKIWFPYDRYDRCTVKG